MGRANSYLDAAHGRSVVRKPGIPAGKMGFVATCSDCGKESLFICPLGDEGLIDKNFITRGWRMARKPLCPECSKKSKGGKAMAAPSNASIRAQISLVSLLSEHFNASEGRYSDGWHDERIAKETTLAVDYVRRFRREGYGEIKEPDAIAALRADIKALEQLQIEAAATFAQGLAELKSRLATEARKFAA